MFVEVVRRYLASLPPEQTGWLAGLRDPFVGRALAAAARSPRGAVDGGVAGEEGGAVALGAGRALRPPRGRGADAVPDAVADAAGGDAAAVAAPPCSRRRWRRRYASEAAFSRAFKRVVGVPAAAWREREADGAPQATAR